MITRMITLTTITGTATTMLDDFLTRAALAGFGLSLATGPLGSFVVWRRMAYFGDATSHAAILGVAFALATDLPIGIGTLVVALAMALTVATLAAKGWVMDTALGVLAHSALALGLEAVSFLHGIRTDLSAWLFGDILAVSKGDVLFIWAGALVVLALLAWRWQALLTATLNEDLAHASGLNPDRERLILVVALAIVVAVAINDPHVLSRYCIDNDHNSKGQHDTLGRDANLARLCQWTSRRLRLRNRTPTRIAESLHIKLGSPIRMQSS